MFFNTTNYIKSPFPTSNIKNVFAIGDIHGHADELLALHQIIEQKFIDTKKENIMIHLGDYIDRGTQSKEVLNILESYNNQYINPIFLKGNHDQNLIELIKPDMDSDLDKYFISSWYDDGGVQTMKSLGVEGYGMLLYVKNMFPDNIKELRNRTLKALGEKNINFLLSLKTNYQNGNFYYAHAGINPKKNIEEQNIMDLLLIREPFLSAGDDWKYPFCVVHGHSISAPNVHSHRISTDAGIYINGTLCAVEISEYGIRFIGITKNENFPWKEKFNNKSINLVWNTPEKV